LCFQTWFHIICNAKTKKCTTNCDPRILKCFLFDSNNIVILFYYNCKANCKKSLTNDIKCCFFILIFLNSKNNKNPYPPSDKNNISNWKKQKKSLSPIRKKFKNDPLCFQIWFHIICNTKTKKCITIHDLLILKCILFNPTNIANPFHLQL
jgi:hypothetical protein